MGGALDGIEEVEKEFRIQERRNEIMELVTEIEDFKSEFGKKKLKQYTDEFEETNFGDSDDEEGISDQYIVHTKLPWLTVEGEENQENVRKYIHKLIKSEDLLIKLAPQLKYQFDFNFDKYVFLAHVTGRIFPKLSDARMNLVPDEVSDEEFWRNVFYHIELFKM